MTRMFAGQPIAGLGEKSNALANEMSLARPVEFDAWVAAVRAAGFDGPTVLEHLSWLAVNDPRIVRNGKRIRRYDGPTDEVSA